MSEAIPCGGCGATENSKRCIGCLHDFGTPDSAWVQKYRAKATQVRVAKRYGRFAK